MSYFSIGKIPHLIESVSSAIMYFVLKINEEAKASNITTKKIRVQENAYIKAGIVGIKVIKYITPTSQ